MEKHFYAIFSNHQYEDVTTTLPPLLIERKCACVPNVFLTCFWKNIKFYKSVYIDLYFINLYGHNLCCYDFTDMIYDLSQST